jgi:tRNA pseudouridine13 synthase
MSFSEPLRLFGGPIGSARFKLAFEDFQVDEVLGFLPSGDGEHCLVWIEKTDRNTNDVATALAKQLGIRKRLVSHCGLKDRRAITRQWFSIHLPGVDSPTVAELSGSGYRALEITRNLRKLRRGYHAGNRFSIRLRQCDFTSLDAERRWDLIARRGVPNYFGPQRFGWNGSNVEFAVRFMQGKTEVNDRGLRGILISAARSHVFNRCVARRIELGIWDTPIDGDVFGFPDNRSLVLPEKFRGDESVRFRNGTLELTAPLWGNGELQTRIAARNLEMQIAQECVEIVEGLSQFNLQQERRVIRLKPQFSKLTWESDSILRLQFELPTGTYATTLLSEFADLKSADRDDGVGDEVVGDDGGPPADC